MFSKYSTVVAASVAVALTVYYIKNISKKTVWIKVGSIDSLHIYPLKSGHRVDVESAHCTQYGLQLNTTGLVHLRDRCLVVYKEETKAFQTARNYKKLLVIHTTATENGFILSTPESKQLILKIPNINSNFQDEVIMWNGEKVFTIDCGDEAAKWISKYLLDQDFGFRIGFHDGLHKRNIRKYHQNYIKINPKLKDATSGMYSDLSTVLVINKSSVNDLLRKIPNSQVTAHNFRSNIIVGGDIPPYDEDNWEKIKIGNVVFKTTMPCSRCSMAAINSTTADYHKNFEPIKTLKTYRPLTKYRSGQTYPNFGLYMSIEKEGTIYVGDEVYIEKSI